jgi:hypothetical protein
LWGGVSAAKLDHFYTAAKKQKAAFSAAAPEPSCELFPTIIPTAALAAAAAAAAAADASR